MTAAELLHADFATLSDLIRAHAAERPNKIAIVDERSSITFRELDRLMDRVAAALQRDGTVAGQAVAIVSHPSIEQAAIFLGALRAGSVAAPIAPSATPAQVGAMIADSGAALVFLDAANAEALAGEPLAATPIRFDTDFARWLASDDTKPARVEILPQHGFNIIYSSGTTGTPKGIVQSHAMRWQHLSRNAAAGFGDG